MVKGRIACFLTCGYTESGAMQSFLNKINSSYEYKQYLPNRTPKKKGDPKNISPSLSGLTGKPLLDKIYTILKRHKDEISKCVAILIEDDLDARFYGWTEQQKKDYVSDIKRNVWDNLGKELPVFIFFASPEIESWFIADWKNSFDYVYCSDNFVPDLDKKVKTFFVHHLKDYIEKQILKEKKMDIESFGMVDGKYVKLSEQIVLAVQTNSKNYIQNLKNANTEYVNRIRNSKRLYYSKKLHGDAMLRKLDPMQVEKNCRNYFRKEFHLLKAF